MSIKNDKILKNLQNLKQISHLYSPKTNQYHLLYTPRVICKIIQKLLGPYKDCSFKLKLILPGNFPESAPQIYFLSIPYHLNIDKNNGRFMASFLNQDWCSFMSFEMIFEQIKTILEKPQEKSAVCQSMKKLYLENSKFYFEKVNAWRSSENNPSSLKISPMGRKHSVAYSNQSFPDSITEQEVSININFSERQRLSKDKNKPRPEKSSQEFNFCPSSRLKRKGSSPLESTDFAQVKKVETNLLNPSLKRKGSLGYVPNVSNQKERISVIQQEEEDIVGKDIKIEKDAFLNQSPTLDLKKDRNLKVSQQQKVSHQTQALDTLENPDFHVKKSKNSLNRKQTLEIRNLFKEKQQKRSEKCVLQLSISSIQQKVDDSKRNDGLQRTKVTTDQQFGDDQIHLSPDKFNKRSQNNIDQQKTTRKTKENPKICLEKNEQKSILSESISTIKLAQKLAINEMEHHEMNAHLQTISTLIRAMVNQCKYMEKAIAQSQNQTFKKILQRKMTQEIQFIQKLENISIILKKSIVDNLASEVQRFL